MGGLWVVVCGLWFVVCGLWFVVCGLWFVVCGFTPWAVAFILQHTAQKRVCKTGSVETLNPKP